jgi:pyruvate formate lyase activating enzyme
MSITANYWELTPSNKIKCNLCPRHCQMKEGQRGFCYVRKNVDNHMVLTTYGSSSGFCVDPIEKKPLNHFYPGHSILSFGTVGCNLGCKFCQNWDISKAKEMDKLQQAASPKKIAISAKRANCIGVAFTYNDPVIFIEYAIDIAHECHNLGLKTVAVSAGYITKSARKYFFEVMDAVNIDLKAFTQAFYKKLCMANLEPILETLIYIKHHTSTWLEITTLLIPNENDSEKEIRSLCKWIRKNLGSDVPIHFSAFHPDYKLKDKEKTPAKTLFKAYTIAKEEGIHFVYTGNIYHEQTQSTYCASCNLKIISRNWQEITSYDIVNGNCARCSAPVPGYFPNNPGKWGRKRQSLWL